ncbi:class III lanthionine synthetase LanKC [Microbacterium sp. PRF11]|uniref:class III lanthionine synthetase LanKC n=1 Tax=Microbacterium sp. PRF11 TaxID=2962593 RepID=UPI002881F8B4|nr:class III lanthionine synthetase LanKC [Microbacterium sp. PRF11]MDT0116599.1 class III lanthionine synthetase LanKC [Microbacterium sp. PRF11]
MDPIYPRYARAHPVFYDRPAVRSDDEVLLRPTKAADWSSWSTLTEGPWTHWGAPSSVLPEQGWKVHISATPSSAGEALERVSTFCHARGLSFKHLSTIGTLHSVNGKDADRSAAGKFVTIYPPGSRLESVLVGLDEALAHLPGPYILSDLRWNRGPVHVRYGAFIRQTVDVDGVPTLALRRTDGQLVPDIRSPQFVVPEWVATPPFIKAQRKALESEPIPDGFPTIVRALHHSNAGGVYEAVESDGSEIVLKEARPHSGLTPDGADAITRLRREAQTLRDLSHLACVVNLRGEREVLGHRFLAMSRISGRTLQDASFERYPLIRSRPAASDIHAYRRWALSIMRKVKDAVARVHKAGYSHGDLHPRNVLITDDEEVVLLDFEMAQPIEDDTPHLLGAPGFVPPDERGGAALDHWAVACMELSLFAPLTPLINLDRAKAEDLARWSAETFDLDHSWVSQVTQALQYAAVSARRRAGTVSAAADVIVEPSVLIGEISEALVRDATLDRLDRAWPGDPAQFSETPAGLAHGAGGVLLALQAVGAQAPDGSTEWFQAAAEQSITAADPAMGLMDGVAGILWTRHVLGDCAGAARARDRLLSADPTRLGPGIYRGSSGIGITLLETGDDPGSLQACRRVAEALMQSLEAAGPASRTVATGQAGLMHGWSGAAMFGLRLFERTGTEEYLRFAERALERDLAACRHAPDGSLQVDEGWRLVPYLGTGSAGIGLALSELERIRPRAGSDALLTQIVRAATSAYVAYPGLLQGRSGLVHLLLGMAGTVAAEEAHASVERQVQLLGVHAIRRAHGVSFPGHGLLRLSCDLATGSAGVLTALSAYEDRYLTGTPSSEQPLPVLPFLASPRARSSAQSPARVDGGR